MSTTRCHGKCSASSSKTPQAFIAGLTSHGCRSPSPFQRRAANEGSGRELLLDYPLFEIGIVIEQQRHCDIAVFADLDGLDIAYLGEIGNRTDGAFIALERIDADLCLVRQQRSAPAARAEGADRSQSEDA